MAKDEVSFVKKPEIETVCHKCGFQMLMAVYQMECCGELICGSCNGKCKINRKCPFCNTRSYKSIVDQHAQRLIQDQTMYCPNKKMGCKWRGEVRNYKDHVKKGERKGPCEYEVVQCCHGGCTIERNRLQMNKHELECEERPIDCQYCGEKITFRDIKIHNEKCLDFNVKCSKCKVTMKRRELEIHECPYDVVKCKYCNDEAKRKDLRSHMHDKTSEHLEYVYSELQQSQIEKQNQDTKIAALQAKQEKQASELTKLHELENQVRQFKDETTRLQRQIETLRTIQNETTIPLNNRTTNMEMSHEKNHEITDRIMTLETQMQQLQARRGFFSLFSCLCCRHQNSYSGGSRGGSMGSMESSRW
uniref:TRAF-type domain-containing protein n=1 Tax=Amphimedon queenslandica TaxID=400682 RepID=A0A1X7UAK0_AMPQE